MPPSSRTLCLVPRISGVAGPASFQRRLSAGLEARGFSVGFDLEQDNCDAVLVIGGTRRLGALSRVRARGVPVFQRLDGMNWIHRRRRTGIRHYLRAEINNLMLRWVRRRLARTVVYQSEFVRRWWETAHGVAPGANRVIRNGVPLDFFTPDGPSESGRTGTRLLVLEGAIGGGYEIGLTWAVELAAGLARERVRRSVQLVIVGPHRHRRSDPAPRPDVDVVWLGEVSPDQVPFQLRSADLLFSADVHPACPNSVIEALACGLPVVAFDTGAVGEIVDGRCGAVVPYGGDSWKLDPPDFASLTAAAQAVLTAGRPMREGARRRAESAFGLERMVNEYLEVFGWT